MTLLPPPSETTGDGTSVTWNATFRQSKRVDEAPKLTVNKHNHASCSGSSSTKLQDAVTTTLNRNGITDEECEECVFT